MTSASRSIYFGHHTHVMVYESIHESGGGKKLDNLQAGMLSGMFSFMTLP
jgi:hypothetical protein